jgi:hypothetical protein
MRLLEVMASAQSGSALVALVLLLASGGALLNRSGRRGHSTFYAAGAGIIAGLSAALVNFHGIDDPATAMLVSGFYAACALIVNMRVRRTSLGYLSTGLIVLATIWSLWWSEHALTPAWSVTLALEALLMAGCAQWLSTGLVIPRAWRDTAAATACMALTLLLASALKGDTAMHTLAGVLLAATAFVLAWSYRRASIAWAGSALLLGSIWNALGTAFGAWNLDHSWTIALLLHATLVIVVGSAIKTFARGRPDHAVDRVFVRSLLRSGFASSGLVLALLGVPASTPWTSLTIYTSWVAGLWLFLAWLECVPALFTVAQSILALAVYFGVTAWLSAQSVPNPLAGPFGLHAYGIGFGILGLFWASARVLLRVSKVASKLFEPPWPSLDHAMLGLLVLGQMLLAFLGALTGIQAELGLTRGFLDMHWSTAGGYTHGPGAYVLLTILAVDLLFSLRSRQGFEAAGGLVLLCATVPLLLAGSYTQAAAAATVLRWTQAIAFILCSVPLWFYQGAGADFTRGKALARRLLVGTLAIPPILLTIAGAIVWLGGSQPVGPAHDFFRLPLGWVASHAIPLLLVAAGLTGYALRERSSIYAFAAGLVLNLTVAGGYALAVVIDTHGFGPADAVRTIQWGIVTTALWGLCWMVLRRWVYAWREVYIAPQAGVLMRLQVGLAALGTAWLLATSLWLLAFAQSSYWRTIAETGSPLGWLATLLTLIALVYRHHQAGTAPHRHGLGLAGVLLLGLIACSVAALIPDWGFRTLMLAWAGFTPALVIAAWLRQRNIDRLEDSEARAPTTGWRRLALGLCRGLDPEPVAFWVRLLSWMVLVLCLKAALVGPNDRLVAAAALAQIGLASAVMAVWRRREDWAFRAGLCTNLAASLVVWHFRQAIPFEEWGIALAQANLIATSLCGLLWLAARRELYGKQELTLARTPFLGLQVCVGLAGNILILAWPLVTLVSNPASQLSPVLQAVGSVAGWLGLGLAFLAAYLYAGQIAPRQRGHVLVAFGLAVGILAACSVGYHDQASWLSYHVLMGAWIGTGLMILAADSVAGFKEDGPAFSPFPLIARMLHFPAWEFRRWLDFVGVIVLALALRAAWADPTRPYASAGATLAVCAMAGAVALRARSAIYVYISGVLVNLAGAMIWIALSSSTLQDLLHIQVICFALGASIWSALELLLEAATPAVTLRGTSVPFRHLAALAGCLVLALLAFLTIRSDLLLDGTLETGPLCLAALLALMLALGLALWDRSFHFARAAVYALGLMALAFALHAAQLEPRSYGWNATWVLAIYLLVPALLVRGAPLAIPWRQALRLPDRPALTEETWFQPVQALMTFLVLSLSLWVATGFDSVAERLAGPLATFLVMSAVLLLTGGWESIRRYAALYLGVVVLTEIAWALLVGPEEAAPWLHRTALLLVSLVLLTFGYGVRAHSDRLQALFPGAWADVCRRTAPVLGALSCVVLLVLLAQEAFLYDTMLGGTPMALWAIALVALALIALIVAGVFFAVQPHDDPLGLSQQGRTLYVYAGEVLLGLLFIHLRFTAPQLFQFEFFGRFWPFVVMAIAFAGVGLGEYFDRRGLPVLAHPLERTGLFLPLLPLLSFWLVPLARAQPFLLAQPAPYGKHAAIWFLVGGLYSLVAARRRSPRFALLAALTTNIGLWALLYHNKLDFLTHPQMWLIPLALIVLVAEHLNRDRLAASQSAFLRYAALTVIYTSSTSDMFIAGLGESVLLPLVLAVLSIVGILAGILFRVRAFLYLGFTFLFLVIFTQIYHAAVGRNQPWVWWVSLIVLGAAIIALFAVFEKRRNDVMRLLEDVRTWN